MFRSTPSRGFTLIELLVVIAIIAILAAILFPVFARAREKARQTTCTNNQRQIAASVLMYVQDHDETFPVSATMWQNINVDAGVLVCPTKGKSTPNGYGYRTALSGLALGTVNDTNNAMMTADCLDGRSNLMRYPDALDSRHTNSVISAFVDGHVETLSGFDAFYKFCLPDQNIMFKSTTTGQIAYVNNTSPNPNPAATLFAAPWAFTTDQTANFDEYYYYNAPDNFVYGGTYLEPANIKGVLQHIWARANYLAVARTLTGMPSSPSWWSVGGNFCAFIDPGPTWAAAQTHFQIQALDNSNNVVAALTWSGTGGGLKLTAGANSTTMVGCSYTGSNGTTQLDATGAALSNYMTKNYQPFFMVGYNGTVYFKLGSYVSTVSAANANTVTKINFMSKSDGAGSDAWLSFNTLQFGASAN